MELFGKSTLLIKTMLLRQTEEIPICFIGNLKKNHTSDHFLMVIWKKNGNMWVYRHIETKTSSCL